MMVMRRVLTIGDQLKALFRIQISLFFVPIANGLGVAISLGQCDSGLPEPLRTGSGAGC